MSDIDPVVFTQFIERQREEIELKKQEVSLHVLQDETRRLEISNSSTYALAQLGAQERDLADQRKRYNEMLGRRHVFIAVILVILCIFGGYAIWAGAKDVIIDILKIALSFAAGGFGGYHYGKSKQDK